MAAPQRSFRRMFFLAGLLAWLVAQGAGCAKQPPESGQPTASSPEQKPTTSTTPETPATAQAPPAALPQDKKDDYDTHYAQGLVLLTDKKYDEALAEFQKAKAVSDTVEVAAQIEKINQILGDDQQAAQLVKEVESLRQANRIEAASQKAEEGVGKYWNTPSGPRLAELKSAIDADIAHQATDKKALADKNYQKAQDYYRQGDLRNASVVLAETTQYSDDPRIISLYEDAKSRTALYDESLRAADAYMKDPDTYEDAITSFETAQKAWDTQEIRDRLDAAHRALKARRQRIAVVDFDTKGEFDLPNAGSAVAELILPRFQGRFDIIERTQLNRLLQEQNLQMTDLVDPAKSADGLSKIRRVNYLVMGNLLRFGGVHVTARIVQVQSGLIDRTGKITVANLQDVDPYLEDLAAQLTMSEEEYRAFKATHAPPSTPASGIFVPSESAAMVFAGLSLNDFEFVPEGSVLPEEPPTSWREEHFKREMYENLMAMGREFMGKGQFYEAGRQFEMALLVYPNDPAATGFLREAYQRMSYVPRPPMRERIAVLDFMAFGDPGRSGAGAEVAALLCSYLGRDFDVLDRDELIWHMGRWHVSLAQLIHSRQRLMWFGRVMGIRYFVIGCLAPAHSFEIIAKVVDAQTGMVRSRVRMRVHDTDEMRFRMADFSHALFLGQDERQVWLTESNRRFEMFSHGREAMRENKFAVGMKIFAELMNTLQPDRDHFYFNVTRRFYDEAALNERQSKPIQPMIPMAADLHTLERERREAERRTEEMRRQLDRNYRAAMEEGNTAMAAGDFAAAMRAFATAVNLRKSDEAENAYRAAKQRADAQRHLWETNEKAERQYAGLMESGRRKALLGRFPEAIKDLEGALAVKRTDEAKSALDDTQRRFGEFQRQQEAAKSADKARQEAERADRAYNSFLGAGRQHMKKRNYQEALANFTSAAALKRTPEAEAGLLEAQQRLAEQQQQAAEVVTKKQHEQETSKPHKGEEKAKPEEPPRQDAAYNRLMAEGRELMGKGEFSRAARTFGQAYGAKKTDEARAAYDEAIAKVKESQAAEAAKKEEAQKAAEDGRRKKTEEARTEREKAQAAAQQARLDKDYADAMADGKQNLEARHFDRAAKDFARALGIKATPEAQAALAEANRQAEQAKAGEQPQKQKEEGRPKLPSAQDANYTRLLTQGREMMEKGEFSQAARLFGQAYGIRKTDEARAAYDDAIVKAKDARAAEEAKKEEAQKAAEESRKKKAEEGRQGREQAQEAARQAKLDKDYADALVAAQRSIEARNFARAIREINQALAIKNTPEAQALLNQARQAEQAEQANAVQKAQEEKARQEAARKAAEEKAQTDAVERNYQRLMAAGQVSMRKQRFAEAMKSFSDALQVRKTDEAQASYDEAKAKLAEAQAAERAAEAEQARKAEAERQAREEKKRQEAQERADKQKAAGETKPQPPGVPAVEKGKRAADPKKLADQLQKRFMDCKRSAAAISRMKTPAERTAALQEAKADFAAAEQDMATLAKNSPDPKVFARVKQAHDDSLQALQAAEAEANKKQPPQGQD